MSVFFNPFFLQRLDGSVGRSDEVRIEYFYYDEDSEGELEVLKHPEYHTHFREGFQRTCATRLLGWLARVVVV